MNVLSLISFYRIRKTRNFENKNHVKFSSSVYKLSKCRTLNVATRYSLIKRKGKDEFTLCKSKQIQTVWQTKYYALPGKKNITQRGLGCV